MSRKLLKELLPPWLARNFTGLFYGWYGNYSDWELARKKCSGYDSKEILEKVKKSSLRVKEGLAAFERDSIAFKDPEYNYSLLTAIMWIAVMNHGKLKILDFGGSLGSTYFQHKLFFDSLPHLQWYIVEQPDFIIEGQKNFSDERLMFSCSIDDCIKENNIDIILLSSVLPYIEKPYELLESIKALRFEYILFDKMPLIHGSDKITVQKVNPAIYKASYPCWFFNSTRFLDFMKKDYDLIFEFNNSDRANIQSEFKGFLFRIKD